MILLLDNYDSFTYNLLHYLGELGAEVQVARNDALSLEDIAAMHPEGIVISPGPGTPKDAGICEEVIRRFGKDIPILGVCLGHQGIAEVFGGSVIESGAPMHGKVSEITHRDSGVFKGLPSPFPATRYHSLVVAPENVPDCLEVNAETADGTIMGLRHKEWPVHGVQFHPESIASRQGHALLRNFLDITRHSGG